MPVGDDGVKDATDAADAETEDQAFQVEAGSLRQIKERRRVPVFGHEQRLGQAEQRGHQTDLPHRFALLRKGKKQHGPRDQEGRRPGKPDVLVWNHKVIEVVGRYEVFTNYKGN